MSYPEHEPYHERRLDQQMLDTLLRIEELLRSKQDAPAFVLNPEPPKDPRVAAVVEDKPKGKRK